MDKDFGTIEDCIIINWICKVGNTAQGFFSSEL